MWAWALALLACPLAAYAARPHARSAPLQPHNFFAEPLRRSSDVRGDLAVDENLFCERLAAPGGHVALEGDLDNAAGGLGVDHAVVSKSLHVDREAVIETLVVGDITTSDQLSVHVSGAVNSGSALLQTDELQVGGARQWELAFVQTFEDRAAANDWRGGTHHTCAGGGVLLGPCGHAGRAPEASRVVDGLPPHERLMLSASFMFIDDWHGEHAYATLDGAPVWLDRYDGASGADGGVDLCGGPTPERRWRVAVRGSVAHNASRANVTFGSTATSCDAGWAVDGVELHVR